MTAKQLADIRDRADFAVSREFAEMLADAPEDGWRWGLWLGSDVLALLGELDERTS